jgi:hypothetical protein
MPIRASKFMQMTLSISTSDHSLPCTTSPVNQIEQNKTNKLQQLSPNSSQAANKTKELLCRSRYNYAQRVGIQAQRARRVATQHRGAQNHRHVWLLLPSPITDCNELVCSFTSFVIW